jgi:cell division septation protein DedD
MIPDEARMWIAKSGEWVRQAIQAREGAASGLHHRPAAATGRGFSTRKRTRLVARSPIDRPELNGALRVLLAGAGNPNLTTKALIQRLNDKGLPAVAFVLRQDKLTRVMTGPYANAQALQQEERTVGQRIPAASSLVSGALARRAALS